MVFILLAVNTRLTQKQGSKLRWDDFIVLNRNTNNSNYYKAKCERKQYIVKPAKVLEDNICLFLLTANCPVY